MSFCLIGEQHVILRVLSCNACLYQQYYEENNIIIMIYNYYTYIIIISEPSSYYQSYIGRLDDIQTALKHSKTIGKKLKYIFMTILELAESFKTMNRPNRNAL